VSRNRRTAIAVRSIGVASAAVALALGVAGNAFACNISEFTPSAGCDQSGHGYISVVDKDGSHTPVDITVATGGQEVGKKTDVVGSDEGLVVSFPVEWQPNTKYTITVVKSNGGDVGTVDVTTPEKACSTPTTATTPPTTATTTPPTTAPSTTPSSTTSAPAVGDTNAPSPAAGGGQNLAETGGGSNTGMIAGIAAALVAVGGGAVFALRRRNPAARH
jgi:LPXTG-motif cell wall-anchored protein